MTDQTTLTTLPHPALGGAALPDGWEIRDLRDCGKWLSGGTPSRSNPDYWRGDIPWVSAKSMTSFAIDDAEEYVTEEGAQNGTRLVPEDTLLFVVRGMSLAKEFRVGLTTQTVAFNQDLKALRPAADVDPLYLALALTAAEGRVLHMVDTASHGTAKLNTTRLGALPLLLPPLPVQQQLAEAVDTWDRAVRKLDTLIAAHENRQRGLMQHLLPRHEPDGPRARLAGFDSEPWIPRRVGDYCSVVMGQSPPSEGYNEVGEGLPLIQGNADLDGDRLAPKVWTRSVTKRAVIGDAIVTVRAPVGDVAWVDREVCLGRGVGALRSKTGTPRFLYHLAKTLLPQLHRLEQGSTFTAVTGGDLREVEVSVPLTSQEEAAIADVLDAGEREIRLLRQERAALLQQKKGLMQRLLTGRIRVPEAVPAEVSS